MKRLTVLGVLMAMVMLTMAPATATPPTDVEFEFDFSFVTLTGDFDARGSAVDDGLMCEAGILEALYFKDSRNGKNVQPVETFICGGGEDTFVMKVQNHIDFPNITGTWVIKGGTGSFEDIHGKGTTEGHFLLEFVDDEWVVVGVHEVRTGQMHLD